MNRLKERIKAESEKYQHRFFGDSEHDQQSAASSTPGQQQQQHHHQHVDTSKLNFEALPHGVPQENATDIPIKIANVTDLGDVRPLNTHVVRDLGFAGQIGRYILLSYGDTMYTDTNYSCDTFRGMTSDSIAFATADPLKVLDQNLGDHGWPNQGVPVNPAWGEDMSTHAVGITNAIETNGTANEGIIFTLLNHRPGGVDHIMGAGIAKVKIVTNDTSSANSSSPLRVIAERTAPTIWDGETEPFYGDCGAVRTATHVYAYGHKKDNPWVYLCRAPIETVLDVSTYEYWHGAAGGGWSRDRLQGPSIGDPQSVFWQVNQGQVIWSPHFQRFLFVFCDNFWSSRVLIRSAPAPEGPWSNDVVEVKKVTPITEGGTIYAATPYPHYDPTGKTLVIGFTNHPNTVQAIKVEFE